MASLLVSHAPPLARASFRAWCACARAGLGAATCRSSPATSGRTVSPHAEGCAPSACRPGRMWPWPARRSRSTSAPSGATHARCCARSTGRSCGPSSRPTATATARPTSAARRSAPARPRSAWPPAGGARAAARARRRPHHRHGPRDEPRDRAGARRRARARRRRRRGAGGRARPPQARHRHGPLGPLRAPRGGPRGRRPDEPLRDRRLGRRLHALADRALPRGDRAFPHLTRHIANSAGALRYPEARFDAARCGIALYGLSPFGEDPAVDGLEPALRWDSELAQVKLLQPGRAPATAAATSPGSRRGSASSRSATRTASGAT